MLPFMLKRMRAPTSLVSTMLSSSAPRMLFSSLEGAPSGSEVGASGGALSTPAYVIQELPVVEAATPRSQGNVQRIRGHTKKLNPVARQVTGMSVNEAMAQMAFSSSDRATAVSRALVRATKQAEVYHQLQRSELMVEAAWTGKLDCSPRLRHHNKMRAGRAHKRTSQVWVRLRKMTEGEAGKLNKFKRGEGSTPEKRATLNPRGY